jgi:hypothetical protein
MHAARPPRAAARLSAFLPTFPQALRPFSIWLSIWIGVFGGLFGGLCASTAAAQLPSAKELSGLQTQIEQRLARLGIAREGKNGLRVGSIQASREDGKIVLRAPLHGSAKGSATWNLPAGLRLEEPRVELVVIEATNSEKREFEGALLGTLVLGRSLRLPSESRLSKDPAKFSLSARSERPLSLTSLATALGGEKARKVFAPLPARLRDAKLQSARLRVYPRIKRVALQAGSSLGKVDLVAEPDKGLFVCIAPDPSFRFAQLDPALRILDSLDLDLAKMGFTISSFDGDLGEALAHVGRGLRGRIRSGLNLSSTVDLDKLGLARLLKAQRADIAGVIPYPHPQGLELSARLPTELPIGKAGKFREIDLVLRPAPKQMKVGLRGRMQLRVDGQLLDLVGELAVEAATQTLKGTFALDPRQGLWTEPFELRGVAVSKLALSLGTTFGTGIPLPTLGMQAGLQLGDGEDPLEGNGVFVVNPRDPSSCLIAMDLRKLSFDRITALAGGALHRRIQRSRLGKSLAELSLDNASLRIVPSPVDFAGTRYEPGYRIAGSFEVLGVQAQGLFDISYGGGVHARATVEPIRMANGAFVLQGARGQAQPLLELALGPQRQLLRIQGEMRLLRNLFVGTADLHVQPDRLSAYARGKLFGKLQAELMVEAAGSLRSRSADFYLRARMEQTLIRDLRERVLASIDESTRNTVQKIQKARDNVDKAQAEVQRWEGLIASKRKDVIARQNRKIAEHKAKAKAKSAKADATYRRLGRKISALKKEMKEKPWLKPKNAVQIAALEATRRTQRVFLKKVSAGLSKALAALRANLPRELDHELTPLIVGQKSAEGALVAAEKFLEGYQKAVAGTFAASRWIVANGLGKAFDLHAMQIETRLSTQRGSSFATDLRGEFLGKPFSTRLHLDLSNLPSMAKSLARSLIERKAPERAFRGVAIQRQSGGRIQAPASVPSLSAAQLLTGGR